MSKYDLHRRILIVGEGRETEYNYFVGFRNANEAILQAVSTSISVKRGHGGDARGIVENAIKEAKNFKPNRKRGDRVFLLLDTEGDSNLPGAGRNAELLAAEKLAKKKGIEIVYSSPAIEYWLFCHFEKVSRGYFADCDAVIAALNKKWREVSKADYDKADLNIFRKLERRLASARAQALQIDLHHLKAVGSAQKVNPSTQVYELIAILIGAHSGEKCPLDGTWKLTSEPLIAIELKKGETMPLHKAKSGHRHL